MTRQCWHLTQLDPRASETTRQHRVELAYRDCGFDSRGRVRTVELTKTSAVMTACSTLVARHLFSSKQCCVGRGIESRV